MDPFQKIYFIFLLKKYIATLIVGVVTNPAILFKFSLIRELLLKSKRSCSWLYYTIEPIIMILISVKQYTASFTSSSSQMLWRQLFVCWLLSIVSDDVMFMNFNAAGRVYFSFFLFVRLYFSLVFLF